jgi:ketosteroid isomerase-like protein
MSHGDAGVVRAALQEFRETGRPALALMHPNVEWHTAADLPDGGVHRGHAGVASLVQAWADAFEDFHMDIGDVIDRGDCVVASLVLRGLIRGSTQEVSLSTAHVWKVSDGLIVEIREYRTLEQALDAAGLPGRR